MQTMNATVGTRVRHEGFGMFVKYGTVVEVVPVMLRAFTESGERTAFRAGDEYRVRFEDGSEVLSDLRQRCWTMAA